MYLGQVMAQKNEDNWSRAVILKVGLDPPQSFAVSFQRDHKKLGVDILESESGQLRLGLSGCKSCYLGVNFIEQMRLSYE